MNAKEHMVIVKGAIQTENVKSAKHDEKNHKWFIQFSNEKIYKYAEEHVKMLSDPELIDPSQYRISHHDNYLFNITAIYSFQENEQVEYWHVCFENDSARDYRKNELKVEKSFLVNEKADHVFQYLKALAELSEIKNENTDEKLLPKKFNSISFISEDTVLSKYLDADKEKIEAKTESNPIFPFGYNSSQYLAVKRALENQLSVIQGPPGTGKTQTILNIIANIILQGKTVQVVSNNNDAIENVYEKLASKEYQLDFLAARLGKEDNKQTFIENQSGEYPNFSNWKSDSSSQITLEQIQKELTDLKVISEMQTEKAKKEEELHELEKEQKYFLEYLNESKVEVAELAVGAGLSADEVMDLLQECQALAEQRKKFTFFIKIKFFFKYCIFRRKFYQHSISEIITSLQKLYYDYKIRDINITLNGINSFLNSENGLTVDTLCQDSMDLLKDYIANKFGQGNSRQIFSKTDLKEKSDQFLHEYPVVLSTTFSSTSSLNKNIVFDYLIMDEASQIDLVTGALAFSCAKNAVIVGDEKQLPNVITNDTRQKAEELFTMYQLAEGYRYTNSFLQSVLNIFPDVEQTMLREHYRCHPKIINFCNQKFYNGELIIMTEDHGESDVLKVIRSVQGNHTRGHYSQRQIDIIKQEILPKCEKTKQSLGIIAPYNEQVEALKKEFPDVDIATVHKFQGREKDTIILSTVDDEISDFVDDPYLLNVAVSRAKRQLILVVSGNEQRDCNINDLISYIQYNNFEVTDSKVYSIFDYLYKQYTEARQRYLKRHRRISDYDSENLMYAMITDVLQRQEFTSYNVVTHFQLCMLIRDLKPLDEEEIKYVMNPATHLDFLIINRISKSPVLAIEVDGYYYHKNKTVQAERDHRKNHILEVYGIPFIRMATNGSGERKQLENALLKSSKIKSPH